MAEKKNELTEMTPATENLVLDLSQFQEFKSADGVISGMEAMDSSDIKMPRIKLIQSTSEEAQKGQAKAGQFYNSVTGEAKDELEVVLLVMGKSRVRFEQPYKRGAQPLCRSFDGKASTEGEACATCPYADWDKAKKEGNDSPDCRQGITWMFLETDNLNSIPPRMVVSGASMSDQKNFLTKLTGLGGYPPYILVTKITAEQQTNDKGIFYVAKFDFAKNADGSIKTNSPAEATRFKDLSEQWKAMTTRLAEYDTERFDDSVVIDSEEGGIY
jgi:hypothetical protein